MSQHARVSELEKELAEEKKKTGTFEAKLEVLLQQVSVRNEPERIQLAEKQEMKLKRLKVRDEAIAIATKLSKGKEPVTHVKYVTASFYQRKGVLYSPGTVLKIPVTEEPAQDWKAHKPAVVTRPGFVDPDSRGTPIGEVSKSSSALAALKRDEQAAAIARGDVIVTDTLPDQGELDNAPPQTAEALQAQTSEQGPEAGASPRASDADVG